MNQAITDFIQNKNIALVGAARDGKSFGCMALKELRERGYQVFIVHPHAQVIAGQPCFPNLAAVRDQVGGVLVSVPAVQAEVVLREAAALGLRNVWLQQGAETPQLLALGEELGLNLVSGKCILMYAEPVRSFHKWHRGFVRLFGRL